jgi:rhodanese-related sulfurtransferase
LVAKLKEKGVENAFALVGGTNGWKTAGYPMEGESGKD